MLPPIELNIHNQSLGQLATIYRGCWIPKAFDKAIILIIDALRYDFTIPSHGLLQARGDTSQLFHDALTVLYETAVQTPRKAILLPFLADPPTTTLQRLKGLTTGTLPTFIEAGSNFEGSAIVEDNIVTQLRDAGKMLVHLGDDTWIKLFPGHFVDHLSHAYDSFLVEDLHTVDDGVTKHLISLLSTEKEEWDVIFGHFLGVDHVGHRYGPAHPEMAQKLRQIDAVIRDTMATLDDDTLLIVLGDHGMDAHGNHGGETDDEIQAALWMYTHQEYFGHSQYGPPQTFESIAEKAIPQIDLVPTLSLLLGIPIPFNNLGSPLTEAFIGATKDDWERLIHANILSSEQIERFHNEYAHNQAAPPNSIRKQPISVWNAIKDTWHQIDIKSSASAVPLYKALQAHQRSILQSYKRSWVQFNTTYMLEGVLFLVLAVGCLLLLMGYVGGRLYRSSIMIAHALTIGVSIGVVAGGTHLALGERTHGLAIEGIIIGVIISMAGSSFCLYDITRLVRHWIESRHFNLWNWLAVMFISLLSLGFASNSYTIWEANIVLIFLSTFAICAFFASKNAANRKERALATVLSVLFLLLGRIASLSQYCREEQLPFCVTTFYPADYASDWIKILPFVTAVLVPIMTSIVFESEMRPNSAPRLWLKIGVPTALFLNALHWILTSAEENRWPGYSDITKAARRSMAQIVLAISAIGVGIVFSSLYRKPKRRDGRVLCEFSLVFSMSVLLVCFLVSNPIGQGSLAILYIQLLSLRYLLPNTKNKAMKSTIAALLGSLHFFTTGHNATFSSIQWKVAYIPSKNLHYPWSPFLVIMNTFAGPIVAASAIPLLVVSNDAIQFSESVVSAVPKALAVHMLVYNIWTLSTAIWASILRHHLMLFAIFCPRFLMAAVLLLIVDVIACSISVIVALCTE
jgi:phosphatidylinositol glycan class O